MSRHIQSFRPRCHACMKADRPYNDIVMIRETRDGAYVRCRSCGKESYRQSRAARRLRGKDQ